MNDIIIKAIYLTNYFRYIDGQAISNDTFRFNGKFRFFELEAQGAADKYQTQPSYINNLYKYSNSRSAAKASLFFLVQEM